MSSKVTYRTINGKKMAVVGAKRNKEGQYVGGTIIGPAEDYEKLRETITILKDRATMNSLLESRSEYYAGSVDAHEISEAFGDVLESEDK